MAKQEKKINNRNQRRRKRKMRNTTMWNTMRRTLRKLKVEANKFIMEKRKMQIGASLSNKKKYKVDKSKDALPLVLTDGDLDEIGKNF